MTKLLNETYTCTRCERSVTPLSTCDDIECELFDPRYEDEGSISRFLEALPFGVREVSYE